MANPEHMRLVEQGVTVWNETRERNPEFVPDLIDGDFMMLDLSRFNFRHADLRRAQFIRSALSLTNLSNTKLQGTVFREVELTGADFSNAVIGETTFDRVDLRLSKGLHSVEHKSASEITLETLLQSGLEINNCFLKGAKVAQNHVARIRLGLGAHKPSFRSCFLSYSIADQDFVELLAWRLTHRGVDCWLDKHEIRPSDNLDERVRAGIEKQDVFLLCASKVTLSSPWVEREIGYALAKEQRFRTGENAAKMLFILNLDGHVVGKAYQGDFAAAIQKMRVMDFSDAMKDARKLEQEFKELLRVLSSPNSTNPSTEHRS